MAMAGPQIGGISLVFHLIVLILYVIKTFIAKVVSRLSNLTERIFHPYHPGAK